MATIKISSGDTLSSIAKRHGTTVEELKKLNDLKDVDDIQAGKTLKVPGDRFETTPAVQGEASSTVEIQAGETLGTIAQRYGTSVEELAKLNKIQNPDRIFAGKILKIGGAPHEKVEAAPSMEANFPLPPKPIPVSDEKSTFPESRKPKASSLTYSDSFKKEVALTFDDGPNPKYTPKVLSILKEHGVNATFFVTGKNAEAYPELIRQIVAEGNTLGNHTWDHPDLSKTSKADMLKEMTRTQNAVDKALGYHYEMDQMRPPYGAVDSTVKETLKNEGDSMILWNVDSNDWRYPKDDQKIMDNIFGGEASVYVRGGVILFHDVHPQSGRVLGDVIERLQEEGFKIEKTDQLLEEKFARNTPPKA
ncbi:MAG TPA: hypothetical protein DD435_17280 [Cyanobacteria bacterium UBA8530]|nr:hypothetical protein [Cyanobacteria bacterium UBA8530]